MLTGSKLFFNAIAFFIIFYISATSASPAEQFGPVESENDIYARAARAPYLCEYPYAWKRRECLPSVNARAWQDVCTWTSYATQFQTEYDNIQMSCPDKTFCINTILDDYGSRSIRCVRGTPGRRKHEDLLVGSSERERARPDLGNTQLEFFVKIDTDMAETSVATVVESDDGTFIVTPDNVIVGKIQDREVEVCRGDKSDNKARECYPKGRFDFRKGDIIDYTWD